MKLRRTPAVCATLLGAWFFVGLVQSSALAEGNQPDVHQAVGSGSLTAAGYADTPDHPVHSVMRTSFSPSVVDPKHPVTLTVETDASLFTNKPCPPGQQSGVITGTDALWGLFLERLTQNQTLVTGDGSEDGGYRIQEDHSIGSSAHDDEALDCGTGTDHYIMTNLSHWVIPASEVAKIPVGCYEAPVNLAGEYFPFGNGGDGNVVWPRNSTHGTIATLAVGTTIATCAPPGLPPVTPAPAAPKSGPPAKAPGKASSGCGPSRCAITTATLTCGKPSAADVTGAFAFKAPDNSSLPILWRFSFFKSDGGLLRRFPASGWYGAQGVAAGKTVLETKIYPSRVAKRMLVTVQDDNDPTNTWSKYANC